MSAKWPSRRCLGAANAALSGNWQREIAVNLKILSGGAAFGLVQALRPEFESRTGLAIEGDYGAVGGMKDRILAGEAVDLIILTRTIVDDLATRGLAVADSITDVGKVETGIAVRSGDAAPLVGDGGALRAALLGADGIYFPDPKLATAGIHFARVLDGLGIETEVKARLRPHPNGATAMAAMAASPDSRPIGCTQVTEIVNTPGVDLVAALPAGYELATIYTAAVGASAAHPEAAGVLARMLSDPDARDLRRRVGFGN